MIPEIQEALSKDCKLKACLGYLRPHRVHKTFGFILSTVPTPSPQIISANPFYLQNAPGIYLFPSRYTPTC